MQSSLSKWGFICLVGTFLGCTNQATHSDRLNFEGSLSKLVQDESKLPTLVYTLPNAAKDLGTYNSFMVDPIDVFRVDEKDSLITDTDIQSIKIYFHQKVLTELQKAGLQIIDIPKRDTLRISLALSDLRAPISLTSETATALGQQFELGGVTIIAAFSEANTEVVVAVVMERSRGESFLSNKYSSNNFSDIEAALDIWAINVSRAIANAHN